MGIMPASAAATPAGEEKKDDAPKERKIVGQLFVERGEDNVIVAVYLDTEDGEEYKVVQDETGKKLGKDMDGKLVEATGTVKIEGEGDDAIRWLTAKGFKEVKEDEEGKKPAPAKEKEEGKGADKPEKPEKK